MRVNQIRFKTAYAYYVNYCELCVSTELRAALFHHIQKHRKGIENIDTYDAVFTGAQLCFVYLMNFLW